MAQKVRGRLVRIAAEEGRPCRTIASPLRGEKQGDAALRHLEQAFFGNMKPFGAPTDAIRLCAAENTYAEVEHAAAQIRK